MAYWSQETRRKTAARLVGVSEKSAIAIYNQMGAICADEIVRHPVIPFGGPVTILQMDKSKFCGKRICYKIIEKQLDIYVELNIE